MGISRFLILLLYFTPLKKSTMKMYFLLSLFDKQTKLLYTVMVRNEFAPLAQLDRVAHYECEGCGLESLMAHQILQTPFMGVFSIF